MANASVQLLGASTGWLPNGVESATSINLMASGAKAVYVVYGSDGHTDKVNTVNAALVVDATSGATTTGYEINRSEVHLVMIVKGTQQLLLVPEWQSTKFDTWFGGDGNYAILARVTADSILYFQNV